MAWHDRLSKPCDYCGSKHWGIDCAINNGGHKTHRIICGICGKKTSAFMPKAVAEQYAKQNGFEIVYDAPKDETRCCEVCGTIGAEYHHWAPRYLFGVAEADKWPTSYLCPSCHARWHKVIREGHST